MNSSPPELDDEPWSLEAIAGLFHLPWDDLQDMKLWALTRGGWEPAVGKMSVYVQIHRDGGYSSIIWRGSIGPSAASILDVALQTADGQFVTSAAHEAGWCGQMAGFGGRPALIPFKIKLERHYL